MNRIYLLVLMLLPLLASAQSADSLAVNRQVDSLLDQSDNWASQRKFDNAEACWARAEGLSRERFGAVSAQYAKCCLYRGRWHYLKNEFPDAERWYQQALGIREQIYGKESAAYANVLYRLALVYWSSGRYPDAAVHHQLALGIRERVLGKEHADYAQSLNGLAVIYFHLGRFEEAEPLHKEALAIREKLFGKQHRLYSESINNLAAVYFGMGQYERAGALFAECLEITATVKGRNSDEYGLQVNNLSSSFLAMGRYGKAEQYAQEAIDVREQIFGGEHPSVAESKHSLANVYAELGQPERAEPLYLQALAILEKTFGGVHPDIGSMQYSLGRIYQMMDKWDQAVRYMGLSLESFEKAGDQESNDFINSLIGMANSLSAEGKFEQAEPYYRRALTLEQARGSERPGYAVNLTNFGEHLASKGDHRQALDKYLEARGILERTVGSQHPNSIWTLKLIANEWTALGQADKALESNRELSIGMRNMARDAMHYLTEREMAQYLQEFSAGQEQSLALAQSTGKEEAVRTAYDNSLFYKGFLLFAASQVKRLALNDTVTRDRYLELQGLKRRLGDLLTLPLGERDSVQIAGLEASCLRLEKDLVKKLGSYGDAMKQVGWKDVQGKLKDADAAIEFVRYRYQPSGARERNIQYAALVLKKQEGPVLVPLCTESALDSLIRSHGARKLEYVNDLYALSQRGAQVLEGKQKGLYDLVWKPLESHLQGVSNICYAAAGSLHLINLNAIPLSETETLADRYQLCALNNTRQLVFPTPPFPDGQTACLIGGLRYDTDSLNREAEKIPSGRNASDSPANADSKPVQTEWNFLPGTEREVKSIGQILGAAGFQVELETGMAGSEEQVKSLGSEGRSPRILHIATHGYFFPDVAGAKSGPASESRGGEPVFKLSDHPLLRSGLILSGGNAGWKRGQSLEGKEDGVLTAYEISQLDLRNTELVVLSACETGLGDIQGNEGVYGLQRAFKIAGVKYIVMSLWQVPDKQTSMLMTTFYRKMFEDKLNIPEAFHAAQKELREMGFDPYQWAGFVLVE